MRRYEILGIAGLIGSGRTETFKVVSGIYKRNFLRGGDIELDGRPLAIRSPRDAIRAGICLLTEDRKAQGLFLSLGIRENLTINALHRVSRGGGWIARTPETDVVRSLLGLGATVVAAMNEIGMAVVRPAEFIILKFSHKLQTS